MDYKKILEGIIDIIHTSEKSDIGFANICSYVDKNCPELKESEDERIRKEILDYIDKATGCKEWVSWLEKQGKSTLIEEIKRRKELLLSEKKRKAVSLRENLSLGGRIAILEELLAFANEKQDNKQQCKSINDKGYCCVVKSQDKSALEAINEEKSIIPSLKDFQEAFELKARQYDIELPNRGYDIYAMCNELYSLLIEQKPTWSEEDERNFQGIIDEIEANKRSAPDYDIATYDRFLSWLKSLKNRYTWKPSDEQMKALKEASDEHWELYGFASLYTLYQDLRKLKL